MIELISNLTMLEIIATLVAMLMVWLLIETL
jgi:hypothetical protein